MAVSTCLGDSASSAVPSPSWEAELSPPAGEGGDGWRINGAT